MPDLPRLAACITASFLIFLSGVANGAEPVILVTVEKSGDAFIVDAALDFPVLLSKAWEVLTDFDHMVGILGNLTSSRITARNGNTLIVQQAGKASYGIFSYSFASEREIRLEPMKRIFARQLTGSARQFSSELELSASQGGTQVRYHAEVVPDSAIARKFGGPFIQHEVEEQFTAMAAEMNRRNTH